MPRGLRSNSPDERQRTRTHERRYEMRAKILRCGLCVPASPATRAKSCHSHTDMPISGAMNCRRFWFSGPRCVCEFDDYENLIVPETMQVSCGSYLNRVPMCSAGCTLITYNATNRIDTDRTDHTHTPHAHTNATSARNRATNRHRSACRGWDTGNGISRRFVTRVHARKFSTRCTWPTK